MSSTFPRLSRRAALVFGAFASLSFGFAHADEVLSNYFPENVDCATSVVLPGPPFPGFPSAVRAGTPFVLDDDTTLERVEMRLTTTKANVWLHANTVGPFGEDQPGALLVELHQGSLNVSCPNSASFDGGDTALQAGTKYWIVCEATASSSVTTWHANDQGQTGAFTSQLPFAVWAENESVPAPSLRLFGRDRFRWHLDGITFDDGATASGSFVFDGVVVSEAEIVTTDGSLPGATYTGLHPVIQSAGLTLAMVTDAQEPDLTGNQMLIIPWEDLLSEDLDTTEVKADSTFTAAEGLCLNQDCSILTTSSVRRITSGRVIQMGDAWTNHDNALAGSAGLPLFIGRGQLCEVETTTLDLSQASPNSTAFLVAGFAELSVPFRQGILVPTPDAVVSLPIDVQGKASLFFPWAGGLPAGLEFFYQVWIQDDQGPAGFSASNALQSTSP